MDQPRRLRQPRPRSRAWRVGSWAFIVLLLVSGVYLLLLALAPAATSLPALREAAAKRVQDEIAASQPIGRSDRLYVPTMGVSIDIVTGSDESALLRGAWHRKPENGNPRDGGNFVLSAHRFDMGFTPDGTLKKSPFYHIDKLKVGDLVVVDYDDKRYEYKVSKVYEVDPTQVEIENRTEDPVLTLYSCTLRGSADGRNVIEATPTLR